MSLGRKQNISNDAWLEAVASIEQAVSREELDALTASTVEDIRAPPRGSALPMRGAAAKTVSFSLKSVRWPA